MAATRGEQPGDRVIVAVTGVPGSGKTTLATELTQTLDVPLLSLDTVKEQLYAEQAGLDAYGLRLAAEAVITARLDQLAGRPTNGVVAVVDIWISPGRDTGRVRTLFVGRGCRLVEVVCRIPGDLAAERYADRPRPAPHLPPDPATLQRIREAAEQFAPLGLGSCVEVDTRRPIAARDLVAVVRAAADATEMTSQAGR